MFAIICGQMLHCQMPTHMVTCARNEREQAHIWSSRGTVVSIFSARAPSDRQLSDRWNSPTTSSCTPATRNTVCIAVLVPMVLYTCYIRFYVYSRNSLICVILRMPVSMYMCYMVSVDVCLRKSFHVSFRLLMCDIWFQENKKKTSKSIWYKNSSKKKQIN